MHSSSERLPTPARGSSFLLCQIRNTLWGKYQTCTRRLMACFHIFTPLLASMLTLVLACSTPCSEILKCDVRRISFTLLQSIKSWCLFQFFKRRLRGVTTGPTSPPSSYLVSGCCLRRAGDQRLQEVLDIVGSEPAHRLLL